MISRETTTAARVNWLIDHWEEMALNTLPTDERELDRKYEVSKKCVIDLMKQKGLYSRRSNSFDLKLGPLLITAGEHVRTNTRPLVEDEQGRLKRLADTKFFKIQEMGWVERDYAVEEAVKFHLAVMEGQE